MTLCFALAVLYASALDWVGLDVVEGMMKLTSVATNLISDTVTKLVTRFTLDRVFILFASVGRVGHTKFVDSRLGWEYLFVVDLKVCY